MAVSGISAAHLPSDPLPTRNKPPNLFQRIPRIDGHAIRVRLLNVKVLFSATAIVYNVTKILAKDTLLIRNVYKIIKLLKKIFSFSDGDNHFKFKDLLTKQKARHVVLKLAHNCLNVISGAYDLITNNEITKLAYGALGLGVNFQPLSAGIMGGVETFLRPMSLLKIATKTSHLYLAVRKVISLEADSSLSSKQAAWLILGKASLDFGIEGIRWGLYFAGMATGTSYLALMTVAALGLVSNGLGLVKHLSPVKENAEDTNKDVVLVPIDPPPGN